MPSRALAAVEKRAIFFRHLVRLLDFGREHPSIDLSKVVLTHHALKPRSQTPMILGGDARPLPPIDGTGSGLVRERQTTYISEIIQRLNDLFHGDLTDQDKLVYVNDVLLGKLLESETLRQQAANNSKQQFATSPDLNVELLNAIMGALDAHNAMSTQALNSLDVQRGLKDILLNHSDLYERLRAVARESAT
jgi:type I restriction enzyme R subunit